MSITIQKGPTGADFTVQNPGDIAKPYSVNDYRFIPYADGTFSLISKYDVSYLEDGLLENPDVGPIYRQPYSNVINGDTGLVFADFASLSTYIRTNFFRKASAGAGTSLSASNLVIGSSALYFGDSITQHGSSSQTGNQDAWGFTTWLNLYTGGRLYNPTGGNLGVAGNTTTQMIARLGAALAFKPAIVTFMGGTNDITAGSTAAQIQTNISVIINAFAAINSIVVISSILPRFSGNALTGPQEAIRQTVNSYILTLASPTVIIVNAEASMNNSTLYADGLHPNSKGASVLGGLFASAVGPLLPSANWALGFAQDNVLAANLSLSGTNGTVTGATGTAPTGHTLYASGAGGASVVGSQGATGGLLQEVITISGTYSGSSTYAQLVNTINPITLPAASIVESVLDFEILATLNNIAGIGIDVVYYDSGSNYLADAFSFYANDGLPSSLGIGRYQLRGQAFSTPANTSFVQVITKILFATPASSLPISATIKIHRMTIHRLS